MSVVQLTENQFRCEGDTAYVVADGLCLHCGPRVAWHHEMDCGNVPLDPPAWMTATCETCGGWGDPGYVLEGERCPDCRNGKPIHTFEVKCRCTGITGHPPGKHGPCDGTGTVSYRLAVREVLPIVTTPNLGPHSEPYPIPCVDVTDAQPMLWRHHDAGFKPITIPPATKPGMYLAICDVVCLHT